MFKLDELGWLIGIGGHEEIPLLNFQKLYARTAERRASKSIPD
jgi:hypothetical protein